MTEPKDVRRFGCVAFVFFGILLAVSLWRHKPLPAFLFGVLFLLGCGFILRPAALRPVYEGWIKISHQIGLFVTAVMLSAAYYLIITPFAWAKRIISGRPLNVRPDSELSSYWVDRAEPAQPKERFWKRY